MKRYELYITGRRTIDLDDNEDIGEYVNNIIEGNGEEDGYQDLDELLDDMEYDTLNYRKIVC
jgi:adenylate cyclase class IV